MIYFNDYFIRNWKSVKGGKFEKKLRSVEKSILRAFARTRAKNSTITLSWICTLRAAKGQEAHNLEEVVDPDIVEEKRSK